jgi:hypothetical protein
VPVPPLVVIVTDLAWHRPAGYVLGEPSDRLRPVPAGDADDHPPLGVGG